MKWSDDEISILNQYETTAKSVYVLYHELLRAGFERTYKAVERKVESLGLRKPGRYVTGHERRIGYLDIETTHLKANFGFMLTWCIKERDKGKILCDVVEKDELFGGVFDRRVVEGLVDEMNGFDTVVTYYGSNFDIPFIRTRAMAHGLDFPVYRDVSHKDLYYQVRSKLQLHSNRLEVATKFLGITGKTPLAPETWMAAMYGDKQALRYVLKHNKEDVKVLERLHKRLEVYIPPTVVPV